MKHKPTDKPPIVAPDCFICGRGGLSLTYIGVDLYRHEDCAPGTRMWAEWYDAHPDRHTVIGDILRKHVGVKA
jgi:hypothetical protein